MKKQLLTIALFTAFVSGAVADVASTTGGMNTPLNSATPTNTSDTSVVYKAAVDAAQAPAMQVLAGANVGQSPVFESGAYAASQILGVQFRDAREAAVAIIGLSK